MPACVARLPDRRAPFRRSRRSTDSAVSKLVAERGGVDLMPEMGYKPTNKYLPPRARRDTKAIPGTAAAPSDGTTGSAADRLFAWVDRVLSS